MFAYNCHAVSGRFIILTCSSWPTWYIPRQHWRYISSGSFKVFALGIVLVQVPEASKSKTGDENERICIEDGAPMNISFIKNSGESRVNHSSELNNWNHYDQILTSIKQLRKPSEEATSYHLASPHPNCVWGGWWNPLLAKAFSKPKTLRSPLQGGIAYHLGAGWFLERIKLTT